MVEVDIDFNEILICPLEDIIRKIAASIAEAQLKLDEAALETTEKLGRMFPKLAEVGYMPTWYHMPEINVEIKIVAHYEEDKEGTYRPFFGTFNAKYLVHYGFEAEGSSTLKLKITPIPPPVSLTTPPTT